MSSSQCDSNVLCNTSETLLHFRQSPAACLFRLSANTWDFPTVSNSARSRGNLRMRIFDAVCEAGDALARCTRQVRSTLLPLSDGNETMGLLNIHNAGNRQHSCVNCEGRLFPANFSRGLRWDY